MIELLTYAVVSLAIGYIGYAIGRQHGFAAGREHALDQMAKRHTQPTRQRI
jgi:hypothetical protein